MPPSDNVLELVFSFLLETKPGDTSLDLRCAARPTCRMLETRRMRGFEHVRQELLRRGLKWALEATQRWVHRALAAETDLNSERSWIKTYRNLHYEADRARLNRALGNWELEDFEDPPLNEDTFRGD